MACAYLAYRGHLVWLENPVPGRWRHLVSASRTEPPRVALEGLAGQETVGTFPTMTAALADAQRRIDALLGGGEGVGASPARPADPA